MSIYFESFFFFKTRYYFEYLEKKDIYNTKNIMRKSHVSIYVTVILTVYFLFVANLLMCH